jgi:GalNAc-alpha-(1->4)-GalNAc-alpha-(1->3)-diNAcBac-PP-undecaprenol alpha-1,4-N-acetyl-D-galactosaminyltransferase
VDKVKKGQPVRKDYMFFLPTLGVGGTEKAVSLLAESLGKQNRVLVLTLSALTLDHQKIASVERASLEGLRDSPNLLSGLFQNGKRLYKLFKVVKYYRPRVMLSFLPQCNVLSIIVGLVTPVIVVVNERNSLENQELSEFWKLLRMALYRYADGLFGNSQTICREIKDLCGRDAVLTKNPIRIPTVRKKIWTEKRVISIGRLVHQKGFDLLIESFETSALAKTGWVLEIYGEGPLRRELEQLIRAHDLSGSVRLMGQYGLGYKEMTGANIFALCSRFEGLPNAALEAMSYAVPCLISESTGGLVDIVEHMQSAVIVPPEKSHVADGLRFLALNIEEQKRIGENGRRLMGQYESSLVADEWEGLIRLVQ